MSKQNAMKVKYSNNIHSLGAVHKVGHAILEQF